MSSAFTCPRLRHFARVFTASLAALDQVAYDKRYLGVMETGLRSLAYGQYCYFL